MKLYGIIGFPLTHSFSCEYFNSKFNEASLNSCKYLEFPLESIEEFPELIRQKKHLKGLNITIPYKEQIMKYLDYIDPVADKIGAVNTVKIEDNKLYGYNTDYLGFRKAYFRDEIFYNKALILGNGGAAKAVKYVLEQLNIEYIIVSRKPKGGSEIAYNDIINYIEDYRIIINTTPMGMMPNNNTCPNIPYDQLNSSYYIIDLIYNPEKTNFMLKAEMEGAKIKNGYEMLIIQANESWKIWK